ncbi:response regulator [Paenibacillus lignilyticus]|uniref:histidine kinase n=1 Tax=Paenibacillus lignilyticus TaxID=1172615 RepID=A0ABS5CKF0_9BACL|nr:response regulator [Paenibacillus lignilyticus]
MPKDLILNFAILSVYLFFVSPFFIREENQAKPTFVKRVYIGGIFGLLGVILMFFGIQIQGAEVPLNLRGIALMLAAFFGGPAGALAELIVVYIGRFIKDGSMNWVQAAIGITAAYATGYLFFRIRSYWLKWPVGALFLLIYYYGALCLAGQMKFDTILLYILIQLIYSQLIACFLYYLIRNHRYKTKMIQTERDMSYLLRMQPGFTFRFRKKNGLFVYSLIDGQLLKRVGGKPNDFIGKSIDDVRIFPKDFAAFLKVQYEKAWQGEKITYETTMMDINILVTLHPIKNQGAVVDVIGSAVDTSDIMKRKAADESNKAKSQFLAHMSHEIRTPINAIIGLNYILQQSNLNPKQLEYVDKSITAAKSLLNLVNDVLDLSKIEANKIVLESTRFDLYEVLRNISNLISYKANETGLRFHFDIHHDVPQMLTGDPFRLQQVLLNITNNAVKFTPKGELSIAVNLVAQEERTTTLSFGIRDTGIGMSEEQVSNLFLEFTQADMTTTRKFGGTGLGLVISKKLTETMGGSIAVESKLGAGSLFTVTLPFQSALPSGKPSEDGKVYGKKKPRLLFVCEDNEMRSVLENQLEQLEFKVQTSSDADETRKLLLAGNAYDLILIDWKLSGLCATKLAEEIIRDFDGKSPSVLFISAYHEAEYEAAGQLPYISKALLYPISQSQLYNELGELLHRDGVYNLPDGGMKPIQPTDLKDAVILLVEDNEINQLVAKELLREAVRHVDVASNGEEAVKLAGLKVYDAILMDLQMPVMDGYEATKAIRAQERAQEFGDEVPIIAMTADVMKGVEDQVLSIGMNGYLTKPFDPVDLYNVLLRFCQNKEKEAGDKLDSEGVITRLGGNSALYNRILALFITNHSEAIAQILQAVHEGDLNKAKRLVHTLKGVAFDIGANSLAVVMEKSQMALLRGDREEFNLLMQQADEKHQAIIRTYGRKAANE